MSNFNSRRSRRDDDDGQPWWENDRTTAGGGGAGATRSRGFDDDSRSGGAGGAYYDRDAGGGAGGLPYDEPPARQRGYTGGGGRGGRGGGGGRYDDRERERDDRSNGSRGGGGHDRRPERDSCPRDNSSRRSLEPSSSSRNPLPPASHPAKQTSPALAAPPSEPIKPAQPEVEDGEVIPPPLPELDLTPSVVEEPDPEVLLAERRRKRAEILAKYAAAQPQPQAQAVAAAIPEPAAVASVKREAEEEESAKEEGATPGSEEVERKAKRLRIEGTDSPAVNNSASTSGPTSALPSLAVSRAPSVTPAPAPPTDDTDTDFTLSLTKDASSSSTTAVPAVDANGDAEVSAADYDPDGEDEERGRRERRVAEENKGDTVIVVADEEEEEESDGEEEEDDGESDEDDMFALPSDKPKKEKKKGGGKKNKQVTVPVIQTHDSTTNPSLLSDNYDDPDGYYRTILGEVLDSGRYHVSANLGRGMFSGVVKARDLGVRGEGVYEEEGEEGRRGLGGKGVGEGKWRDVAIKVVRSQESMHKAAVKEAAILRRLMDADKDDKKHLVRLLRTFEHRGHYCMVFESLSMNLREVIKRYGNNVGLNLRAVRAYASQMFLALALLKKCEIMHADLKPDNILVNESKSILKVCDLGSASDVTENEITPYLVSRFYRAPEIILGLPYDCSLDVWSIACTLYELYTGKILFPGRTNNHMLLLIMETKGKFAHKALRKARFVEQHFDENLNFLYTEKNDTTSPRPIPSKPPSDLRSRLMPPGLTRTMKDDEVRLLASFVDLLDKMLSLEPGRRPGAKELLNHPFIRG